MNILTEADQTVAEFVSEHRSAAIPALIAACVGWAIENGAGDLVRATLASAISASHEAEKAWKGSLS